MTIPLRSEYVGFTVDENARIYTVRVRAADGPVHDIEISIPHRAFLSNRVRYQDAAEICFLKLRREMSEAEAGFIPSSRLFVTDAELDEYTEAHTKKAPKPKPRF